MQIGRISRAEEPSAEQRSAAADLCVGNIDLPVDYGHARQAYLDAIVTPAAVLVFVDGEARITACNKAFRRATGSSGEHIEWVTRAVEGMHAARHERMELAWQQPGVGGRHYRAHFARLPEMPDFNFRIMVSLVDRTAEVETARSLRAEMLHDSLTGLPNRIAFQEALENAMAARGADAAFAVLAIDLNRFSRINEGVGALAGDELIITVARRLVSALGPGDMLARMAGDEFGVLAPVGADEDSALALAERLASSLAAPIRLSELEIRIECSIGCALRSDLSPAAADMLRNAQVALKRAKLSGRIERYQPGEALRARRRFSLETDLRRAIEKDELRLAFQPLIDLQTGRVSGFEALARWTHPEHGPIPPTEFVAVAEEAGLIVSLGRWALDATARTFAEWEKEAGGTLPIRIGVNVSPVQLARDDVAQAVASTIAAHGISGRRLTLELTESSIVADPEGVNRVLQRLQDLGCRVATDDFGTGYSSLALLQRLPIDILKIDRSFVADMHDNRDSVAIIRAILSLAHSLGMATTAEGIETVEQERTLAALGCNTGQGYLFARPLPPDEAFAYLRSRSA